MLHGLENLAMGTILPVIGVAGVVFLAAYLVYGRLVARWAGIDPARRTPAVEYSDGNDFVPAPAPIVLGGHFTAIAAAGPVVGPILAGLAFGWVPALLWIVLGAIFIGGVHDSGSLLASIRHKARSITEVVRQHMSRRAYLTFLIFVWLSLLYVIIAFADVTAGTFAKLARFDVLIDGQMQRIAVNGGAVVIGATAYLVLSIVMGLFLRFTRVPWWVLLPLAVAVISVCIWQSEPWAAWLASHGMGFMRTTADGVAGRIRAWDQALLIYCFAASIVPMWLLLQPRGVIGATFLYATLLFGVAGAVIGGLFTSDASLAIQWPKFQGFFGAAYGGLGGQWLFPFLFITIACGACSGFHSIVSSGTTCKQIRNEADVRPVAYGAMLMEGMVAVFALSCVMVLSPALIAGQAQSPDAVYARGIGNFMRIMGIPMTFAVTFGLLAFSSFVFDTLDVCTRLGRYVFQELTGLRGLGGAAVATITTLAAPSLYLYYSPPGSYFTFWRIFGTSNQLLAALTLVGVSVWLWRTGRPVWFALLPAVFMLASTGTALVLNLRMFYSGYQALRTAEEIARDAKPLLINMGVAVLLLGLGALVVWEAWRVWRQSRLALAGAEVGVGVAAGRGQG